MRTLQILALLCLLLTASSVVAVNTMTLGVFEYRAKEFVTARFQPVADEMGAALGDTKVELRVLSLDELDKAISEGQIDFILTNPRHFLAIRKTNEVSGALATLKKEQGGRLLSSLAGVVLTRPEAGISKLSDLKGLDIGVPGKRFLGGFLTQVYEIAEQGYDPETFAEYVELGSHDSVMQALVDGDIDAGFVRTGVFEDWLAASSLGADDLNVLRIQTNSLYPLVHSTRLYPEWALAAMPHVSMEAIRSVSNALLSADKISTTQGEVGFDPPQDYLPVELAARELGLEPFVKDSIWQQIQRQHGSAVWVVIVLLIALFSSLLALAYFNLNKSRLLRRFNALFYYSPSAKLLVTEDPQGVPVIKEANYAAAQLFGCDGPEALVGQSVKDLSPSNQPDGQESALKVAGLIRQLDHGRQEFNWEHKRLGGELVLTKVTLLRFNGDYLFEKLTHQPLYLVALQDITAQEKTRKALEEERNALKGILWGTAAGTWEWEVQTGKTRFNERWAEMVGYRLEELEPTTIDTWLSLCHPDDLAYSEAMLQEHFSGAKDSYDVEVRMRHKDGHWIWVQDRGRVVAWDNDEKPVLVAGTHTDITQRKTAEARANRLVTQMRKHAALLPGTLYQYWQHHDGRSAFPYASEGIYQIYGVTSEEAETSAEPVFRVIDPEDRPQVAESIELSMTNLTTWRATFRVNHPEGHQLWVEGIATPERLEDGSTMWHGYLHDVTDEYQNLVKLEEYRDSLERSNRDLEQFAYAASHDLRQPLRMVTSYAQLLERHLKGSLDEDGSVMLHYMRDGAQRMDSMLLSLLDYSRVGRKGLPRQKMALKESLDEALHFLKPNIDEAEASVEVKGEWPEVFASPDEMTRLFQNLISNSLKYRSRSRSVEIAVTAEGASEEQEWRIRICDNGIGIAPGQIGRLFQVFQRLHTREQYEGTGVGLAICRKIVERHGGEITVESEGEDQGTCFSFTLPKSGKGREGS
jgi:PAS domain S-box-containing protein